MNIEKLIEKDFSGVISVRKNGEELIKKAYGFADINNKIPNEVDTKFATASAGKAFVAVGILQLIENRKLSFDDNIGNILDFDLKLIDRNITVKQLLTHTSGIPDYFDESIMNEYAQLWQEFPNYKIRKSIDLLPLFINKPMMYKTGEKFQYNNTGFVVLGLIIEKITGLLFDEYLTENVFIPYEMSDTGYYELDRLPAKCANSYIYDQNRNEFYTNIYSVDVKGTGAGGAFTTVNDIEKFWDNLLNGKLLSSNMVNKMFTLQSSYENNYYGYGIWLEKTEDGTYEPWFQGCDPGVSFITSYDRSKNINITIISNIGNNVWEMKRKIDENVIL
ncbi:MAG: beta-lactamase family protein [Oscillospiraceae bacterium]|jgi:CubicO group peptidase (beta-lactamase class C family)|nr:beta-lactamase family protein [Oscillospiraceae bacterium]